MPDIGAAPPGPPRLVLPPGPPGEDRFWAWRENVTALWDVAVDDVAAADGFQAASDVVHLGTAIVARTSAAGHRVRRTSTLIARAGVDHLLLQVRLRGTQRGETAAGEVAAGPGDVCFLDMTQPYAGHSTDYEAITLALPREALATFLREHPAVHGFVLRGNLPLGRLLASHLMALADATPGMTAAEAAAAGTGTAALAASCCGPALADQEGMLAAAMPAVLLAIRRHVEARLDSEDLTAERIARRFGLSRSALYRLFEPLGGVAEYVRGRRLARAYRDLTAGVAAGRRPRVADVARACGFESDAVFSRAFRREYGLSPREAQFAAGHPAPPKGEGGPGAELQRWVARLSA